MDSCCALPINEQVFTTMTSASSASGVSSAPACASMPIITSLSTRFLGQPRLTKPTFAGACGSNVTDVFFFMGTGALWHDNRNNQQENKTCLILTPAVAIFRRAVIGDSLRGA